ncbi:MAG: SDR family oxidoreductase [Saprospiraceae bacterium]|nr:SDR family oxidoreductase [Saprospiraceae bacterium]
MSSNTYAIVTGASGGIGYELAKLLAKDNYNLILIARTIEKLNEIKKELENKFSISVITLKKDLSASGSATELFDEIKTKNLKVSILVNNAGFGDFSAFAESDLDKQLRMMQLNIVSLTELSRLFLPELINQKEGKILNIASIAAFMPGPMMSVYYASKAFVLSFTEAISNELKGSGVSATALCPGPTKTKFFDAAEVENPKFMQLLKMADSSSVAKYGYKSLMKGKVIAVPGFMNKLIVCSIRFTPRSVLRYLNGKLAKNQN